MKRREFIALLGAAAAWPLAARAQTNRPRRIAILVPFSAFVLEPLLGELRKDGLVEGENLAVDRRGVAGAYEQFPGLAAELVESNPDALVCAGDTAIRAAQAATRVIPIVAATDDMVGSGLARSLARPGGNTTGVSLLAAELDGKRQEILIDFFPAAKRMAALADSHNTDQRRLDGLIEAARKRGVELRSYPVEHTEAIDAAIDRAKAEGCVALNVLASPLLHGSRQTIIARALELRLATMFQWPETAREGGLLAYGPRFDEFFRQWARQLVKVLRGANPAELPIEQATKFELVVNLKTAHALGLEVPPTLLARADEVIE